MAALPLRALSPPLAPPPDSESNPRLVWEWLLAASLVRIRWAAIPLCLLLIPLFTTVPVGIVVAMAALMGGANAVLAWSLQGHCSPRQLRVMRWVSTALDWAIGLGSIALFSPELADWTPALLLPLILTTGIRFGSSGIVVAVALAILSVTGFVMAQMHVHGVYDGSDARNAWIGWTLLIVTTGCVGHGLVLAMRHYARWAEARWSHYGSALPRLQHGISAREWELLPLLAQEQLTYRQIADELHLSPETIKTHVRHLGSKLGVSGRHQVVSAARRQGLLPPAEDDDQSR